jgi:hypothetical protein
LRKIKIYFLFIVLISLVIENGTKHNLNHIKVEISISEILEGESNINISRSKGRLILKDIKR